MYSGTVSDLRVNGMAEETIGKNRTDIVDKGVKQDGTENTTAITPYQFWSNNYSSKVSEANVFDATFVKLREMVLSYQMPQRFAGTGRRGPQPVAHEVERAAHRSRNQHLRPVGRRFGRRILGDSHDPKLGLQHQINLLNKQDV